MIANSRCIACNLSKKEEKIRKHSDEKKKKEFIQMKKRKRNLFRKLQGFYINMGI